MSGPETNGGQRSERQTDIVIYTTIVVIYTTRKASYAGQIVYIKIESRNPRAFILTVGKNLHPRGNCKSIHKSPLPPGGEGYGGGICHEISMLQFHPPPLLPSREGEHILKSFARTSQLKIFSRSNWPPVIAYVFS
jgi:hypothetical protein